MRETVTISLPQAVRRELDKVAIASMNGPDLTDATLGQYQIEALIGQGGKG